MATEFVDPGQFRTELVLEAATPVPDGAGGHDEDWHEIATLLARLEPVSAEARFGAGQTLEAVTHRVTLRWREGPAAGMRLRKGGRIFRIFTVHDPDESRRYLICRTREEIS